jgi:act minimal PKS acyl carrier protein
MAPHEYTLDTELDELGYESLALAETGLRGAVTWTRPLSWREAEGASAPPSSPTPSAGPDRQGRASMARDEFGVDDLRRILHEAAGEDEGADVDVSTLDTEFDELGYESLALLETGLRIEREFGIKLDDSTMFDSTTPRALIDVVNAHLARRW